MTHPQVPTAETSPAETAPARRPSWLEALGGMRVQFWMCPAGHSDSDPFRKPTGVSVIWVGDVAHCTTPGCPHTSAGPDPARAAAGVLREALTAAADTTDVAALADTLAAALAEHRLLLPADLDVQWGLRYATGEVAPVEDATTAFLLSADPAGEWPQVVRRVRSRGWTPALTDAP